MRALQNILEETMPAPRNMILFALSVMLPALGARADTLPASVRACIGEADPGRRLSCYDREVARVIAPPDTFAATAPPTAPASPAPSPSPRAAPPASPTHLTA
jgi:hypothetical protein